MDARRTTRDEVTAIAHFYRGEISRMITWRTRLDTTTNWAIAASAAMLSVTLASPDSHHGVILCCLVLVFLLLIIEARRYRLFEVSRRRVRLLEANYFAPLFWATEDLPSADWREQLSRDLGRPQHAVTVAQAMANRLRRNYGWIFLVLFVAWWLKVTTLVLDARTGLAQFVPSLDALVRHASVSYIPGGLVIAGVFVFAAFLVYLSAAYREPPGGADV
jgi:uncharacterized membrane protein